MNNKFFLSIIGGFFLIVGVLAYINTIIFGNPELVFWLCYINLVLLGVAVLRRNDVLLMTMLNIMAVPLGLWSIDFTILLARGTSYFGITDYFLIPGPLLSKVITMQHLVTIPLALVALWRIKIKKNISWVYSVGLMIIVFFLTRIFTSEENNVNCVFRSCTYFELFDIYWVSWFLSVIVLILVTNFIINSFNCFKK